jgi:hypothetical protein
MNEFSLFLVTILNEFDGRHRLLQCALKVKNDLLDLDLDWLDPRSWDQLHKLLPLHVQTCGPIVDVDPLFEVTIIQ